MHDSATVTLPHQCNNITVLYYESTAYQCLLLYVSDEDVGQS